MIIVKKSGQRRHIENRNQNTWMTFDSENKEDPLRNGFGSLILFNEEVLIHDRALKLNPVRTWSSCPMSRRALWSITALLVGMSCWNPGIFTGSTSLPTIKRTNSMP